MVDADADNKPYKIPITITYSDLFGQNFSQSNIVGIAVYDEPEYIVNLEESDIYVDGNKGRVIISISNTGPSDINYLTLKLLDSEDYEILSTDTIYVGNLESDDFETAEYDLFVKTDKKNVPLQLKMTYKDNYNNDFEKKIVLPGMKIFTQGEAVKFGLVKANSKAGMILPLMIFGLMALFWVYMFIDLRKNKNLPKYKKTLWLLAFIVANIVGAVLYYFIGKKKTQQQ